MTKVAWIGSYDLVRWVWCGREVAECVLRYSINMGEDQFQLDI